MNGQFLKWGLGIIFFFNLSASWAELQKETISYQHGDTELKGDIYWDDSVKGKRPGILVIHEWWGLNDYARQRAKQLAAEGYTAFAADMYGVGKVTRHGAQAKEWKQQITANLETWQKRAQLALNILKQHDTVKAEKTAAIGYCFGGATVMQLAYAGAETNGVVSFHGSLPVLAKPEGADISTRILVAHGNADSFIPDERVLAFGKALDKAGADWRMISYGNAKHGFTNPGAGSYGIDGLAYHEVADKDSWRQMLRFFSEIFE